MKKYGLAGTSSAAGVTAGLFSKKVLSSNQNNFSEGHDAEKGP